MMVLKMSSPERLENVIPFICGLILCKYAILIDNVVDGGESAVTVLQ